MKQLTVGALAEKLTLFPADLPIKLEGCDCQGACIGVEVDTDDGTLLLVRGEQMYDDDSDAIPGEFESNWYK